MTLAWSRGVSRPARGATESARRTMATNPCASGAAGVGAAKERRADVRGNGGRGVGARSGDAPRCGARAQ